GGVHGSSFPTRVACHVIVVIGSRILLLPTTNSAGRFTLPEGRRRSCCSSANGQEDHQPRDRDPQRRSDGEGDDGYSYQPLAFPLLLLQGLLRQGQEVGKCVEHRAVEVWGWGRGWSFPLERSHSRGVPFIVKVQEERLSQ